MMILLLLITLLSILNFVNQTPLPNSFVFLSHKDLNPVFVPINSTNNNNRIPDGQDQRNSHIQEQNNLYSHSGNIQSNGASYMNYSPDTTSNNFPSVMDMNSMTNYMDRYINTINPLIQSTSGTLFSSIPTTLESSNISGQRIYSNYNNNYNNIHDKTNNIKSSSIELNPISFSFSNPHYPNEQIDYIDNMNVFKSDPSYDSGVLQNSNSLAQSSGISTNVENISSMNANTPSLIPNINVNDDNKNSNLEALSQKSIVEQNTHGPFAHDTNNILLEPSGVESTGIFDMKHSYDTHYNHNIQTLDPLERFEMETLKQFDDLNRDAHQQIDEQLHDDNNEGNTIIPSSQPIEELIDDHHSSEAHISHTTDPRYTSNSQLEKNPNTINDNNNPESIEKMLDSSIHRLDQIENSHLIQPLHPFYQNSYTKFQYIPSEHLDHSSASSKTTPVSYLSVTTKQKSRSLDKSNNFSTIYKPLTKHNEKTYDHETENPERVVHIKEEFNADGSLKPCDF